ncbi:MAG: hypothetical protein AAGG08_12350, partial [Actinomycetota bacterium]
MHYVLDDGGSTWEMLQVSRIRGTELVETHTFDLDQYDEARAYFDSLTSTAVVPELRNRATEIGRRVLDACERLDRSDLHELLADDMVYEYRTDADLTLGGAGSGRERYIDDVLEASRLSDGALLTTAREILAVRGEALYLAEGSGTVGGSSWPYLCLIEARDDRFRRVVFWHESDLDEALRELDRRWVEIDGDSPMRAWGRAWRSAWQSGDLAEVDRLLAPDMRSIDHRQLGLGVRDRAAFLASTTPSAGPGLRFVTRRHLAATDRCGLALVSTTVGDDELVDGLALGLIDDEGRLELQEMFDTAQLDEARRRFDELTSIDGVDEPDHRLESTGVPQLTNETNEIVVRFIDARDRGDWDAALGLAHPDLEARQHRPLHGALGLPSRTDRAGLLHGLRKSATRISDVVQGSPQLASREVLAVRGDQLVLARSVETIDGNEWPYLTLAECRDGQIVALDQWSPEQLGAAARELDRRWMELGGGPLDDFARRVGVAYSGGDVTAFDQLLSPSFERVDHRPLGMGRRDRVAFLQSMGLSLEREMVLLIRQTIAVTDRCSFDAAAGFSGDDEMFDGLTITLLDDDGRLELQEAFELTPFGEASRRFRELTSREADGLSGVFVSSADRPGLPELTNRANEIVRALADARTHQDVETSAALLHPDWTWRMLQPEWAALDVPPLRREEYLADLPTLERRGGVPEMSEREVLAVRGEDLVLVRVIDSVDGWDSPVVGLSECRDGQSYEAFSYEWDQLDEALIEMDHRWARLSGDGPIHDVVQAWQTAFNAGDVDALALLLAPTLESTDHRPTSFVRRDRDGFLDHGAQAIGDGVRSITRRWLEFDDRCLLAQTATFVDAETLVEGLTVTKVDASGRLEVVDLFGPSQLDAARA